MFGLVFVSSNLSNIIMGNLISFCFRKEEKCQESEFK